VREHECLRGRALADWRPRGTPPRGKAPSRRRGCSDTTAVAEGSTAGCMTERWRKAQAREAWVAGPAACVKHT